MEEVKDTEKKNSISELMKFFKSEGQILTAAEFKVEWDQLSDEEKAWFKAQSLT